MTVVVDTNVLVSALLNPNGSPAKVVDMLLDGVFKIVVNKDIIDEYENVLNRKKFKLDPRDVDDLLKYIRNYSEAAESSERAEKVNIIHEDDRKFLDAAESSGAEYLVTGNLKHFPAKKYGKTKIVLPVEFLNVVGLKPR